VAVVVDPIQSVKGKVVIDAFRLINAQLMMMGQAPRQTTSNLGHLKKPSIQVTQPLYIAHCTSVIARTMAMVMAMLTVSVLRRWWLPFRSLRCSFAAVQALIHNLNRHYYSLNIDYRKNELEQKMLLNLHKKKSALPCQQPPSSPSPVLTVVCRLSCPLSCPFCMCLLCSWSHGLKIKTPEEHTKQNEKTMQVFACARARFLCVHVTLPAPVV
jgi:hypothetical protein